MTAAVLFGGLVLFMAIGVPVAFSIGLSALATLLYEGLPLEVGFQQMTSGMGVFSFLAIPFFIFAGELMLYGGIAGRIVDFAKSLVGHVRGGLGMSNVVACTLFGGVSGSPVADVSAMGAVMIPMMKKEGYHADYAVNVTTHAALVGALMPTSHNMIIYALAAGGQAGAIPKRQSGGPIVADARQQSGRSSSGARAVTGQKCRGIPSRHVLHPLGLGRLRPDGATGIDDPGAARFVRQHPPRRPDLPQHRQLRQEPLSREDAPQQVPGHRGGSRHDQHPRGHGPGRKRQPQRPDDRRQHQDRHHHEAARGQDPVLLHSRLKTDSRPRILPCRLSDA